MISLWWLCIPAIVTGFILLKHLNKLSQSTTFIALTNPVFLAIVFSALILITFNIPYETFSYHTQFLSWLLEPAIVALALPLYKQFLHVRKSALLIFISSIIGIVNATLVGFLLSIVFAVPEELAHSVAALSVTTPITLMVTDSLGGIASLAAAMVIFIGLLGALFGFIILQWSGVLNHQAQGVAIGTACHAIGTAAALNKHPQIGAFSSVAMALSALLTAIIVPWLYPYLSQLLL